MAARKKKTDAETPDKAPVKSLRQSPASPTDASSVLLTQPILSVASGRNLSALKEPKKETTEKRTTEKKRETNNNAKIESKAQATKTITKIQQEKIQPEINIGLVGHVDHGKTTLTEQLSGKWTDTHSEELKRGITIRLGYADAWFSKCTKCGAYTAKDSCKKCSGAIEPLRKVSFVDAPGHESLMATMFAGATIMDGALLLVAANESCPQPQTREHLMALQIVGIKNIVIVQNKIDLVKEEEALKNYQQIKAFIKGTAYENAPIVPIAAKHGVNIDLLIQTIQETIPTPERDPTKDPIMLVARSFDINRPGTKLNQVVGGVLGGSLVQGKLSVGNEIEIRPGREIERGGKKMWVEIHTKVISLKTGGASVESLVPGGSIGVLTSLDPAVVKSDMLTGSVVGLPGKLPPVHYIMTLELHLLDRVVGAKEDIIVEPIKLGEPLMMNVNSAATVGTVTKLGKEQLTTALKIPVCARTGSRVTISRRIGARFRLIGYGIIKQ
ncbi:translation initiation factor IF-2 subunit gamma [Candidatus Woesearchaeota archaeon]|nr:translation initiation factor IF-2 subunit gamma [Candidatus Woesearchaeota archaeon]